MGAMSSQITSLTQHFIRAQIKENIKGPRHWPVCGEFPAQMASNAENFPFDDVIMLVCVIEPIALLVQEH